MAYADGMLIVSNTNGFGVDGGTNVLYEYDPTTLALIQTVPVAMQGFVSGLAGDGLAGVPQRDWYSVNVQAGQSLLLESSTPSDQGGQFPNTASLEISLYEPTATWSPPAPSWPTDGMSRCLFNAPISGQYYVEISEDPGGQGEYYLSVSTASYPSGGVSGAVYNDLAGSGSIARATRDYKAGKSTCQSSGDFVASTLTDANGDYSFAGLEPGTYTVQEDLQAGWTSDRPGVGHVHRHRSPREVPTRV